jgi:rod shape-determining protein MreC
MFLRFKRKKLLLSVLSLTLALALFSYWKGPRQNSLSQLPRLQRGFQDLLAPVHGLWTGLSHRIFSGQGEETARLMEENARLRQQVLSLEEEKKTWQLWQGIRSDLFKDLPPGIAARVIASDPSAQRHSVLLDKGSQDGLRPGQVVLAQGGLVGRLVQVGEKSSRVLLLTDPISVVDVLAQSSRARGTIKGGRDGWRLGGEYFLIRDTLQKGDLLLTSGQDGLFPKGIPVGIVRELQKEETGIFYRAQVEPVVQMEKVEVVEVL